MISLHGGTSADTEFVKDDAAVTLARVKRGLRVIFENELEAFCNGPHPLSEGPGTDPMPLYPIVASMTELYKIMKSIDSEF